MNRNGKRLKQVSWQGKSRPTLNHIQPHFVKPSNITTFWPQAPQGPRPWTLTVSSPGLPLGDIDIIQMNGQDVSPSLLCMHSMLNHTHTVAPRHQAIEDTLVTDDRQSREGASR